MDKRTRQQEQRYNQALGYGWGRQDSTPYSAQPKGERQNLTTDVMAFATFFSMAQEMSGHHRPLDDAWNYFRQLPKGEQEAYGREWMRSPHHV